MIYNFKEGGWVKGPKISGKLVAPGADWTQVLPGGSTRLDVRGTIKTDDDALIYLQYKGIFSASEEAFERMIKGDVLTSKDIYVIITPTLRASEEKYAWLNHVRCIGKVVEVKEGEGGYIKYDIFISCLRIVLYVSSVENAWYTLGENNRYIIGRKMTMPGVHKQMHQNASRLTD